MTKMKKRSSGSYGSYGIRTVEAGRPHPGLYRVFAVLLILIICGAIVWAVKAHSDSRGYIPSDGVKPLDDNDAAALTFAEERASENAETAAAIRDFRARENDSSANQFDLQEFERQRQVRQKKIYDEALQAFNERKFDKCRSILRDMLASMDASDRLFDPAASLLGRASMNIYLSGKDSETNVDYSVKSGDTLSKIALNYNTSVSAIQKANGMTTTRLNIGQKLKIPQSVWSIEIRRSDNRLFLKTNNKLFKVYNVYPGSAVSQSSSGTFRIFSKQKDPVWRVDGQTYQPGSAGNIVGARWMALKGTGANANATGTAIHGTNRAGTPDASPGAPGYFRLSNDDVKELYDLVPLETTVEIK